MLKRHILFTLLLAVFVIGCTRGTISASTPTPTPTAPSENVPTDPINIVPVSEEPENSPEEQSSTSSETNSAEETDYLLILISLLEKITFPVNVNASLGTYHLEALGTLQLTEHASDKLPAQAIFQASGHFIFLQVEYPFTASGTATLSPLQLKAHVHIRQTESDIVCTPALKLDNRLHVTCIAAALPQKPLEMSIDFGPFKILLPFLKSFYTR